MGSLLLALLAALAGLVAGIALAPRLARARRRLSAEAPGGAVAVPATAVEPTPAPAPPADPDGLLLVDVDHFGLVDVALGEEAADGVLAEVGRTLARTAGDDGSVRRIGGDRFAVEVAGADAAGLRALGERLRGRVVSAPVVLPDGRGLRVSVSIGAADGGSPEERHEAAVRALRAAKRRGRDRVVHAADLRPADEAADDTEAVRAARVLALGFGLRQPGRALHAEQVGALAGDLATTLRLDAATVERCRVAGLLHDIGAADAAAAEDPADAHPQVGHELVRRLPGLEDAARGVLHHHRAFDGRDGAPAGDRIPVEARVVAVADAYACAGEQGAEEPLAVVRALAGGRLDPVVVDALARTLEAERAARAARLAALHGEG